MRVAVVGAGRIAGQHLPVLTDLPDVEVVALADPDPQRLQETAQRFGIRGRYPSHADLLAADRPDAVFVLVSVLQVAQVAEAFLRAGVPTFLEKPPGLYTRETRQLADLARQTGTPAMVGVNRRFYAVVLAARERLLAEGGGARSVAVEAHEDIARVRGGGKFPEEVVRRWGAANGIHALDLLRLFGGEVASVAARQQTVEGPMADGHRAWLEFESGATGSALVDWFAPGGHRFQVRGPGITATSSPGFETVTVERRGRPPETLEPDAADRRYKAGFYRQDRTFLDCVRQGRPFPFPACDLDDAARTMALIDRITGQGD